jgi:RNA polymerase sigma factor (sigma-70 family)
VKAISYKDLTDPELVSRCLAGDALAWETLIMRYRRLIYSIPNKFGFSPSDCSDVFQTVCVKLIEHLGDLKDEAKVSAWLITTTTRHCIHTRSLKQRSVSDEERLGEMPDPGETTEQVRIRTDRQQKVRDTIAGMSERCRKLLGLLYFDTSNPSYAEIGRLMNMPVPSIGPTRARCLDKLRTLLRRRGID